MRHLKINTILLPLIFFSCFSTSLYSAEYKVILMAGQSNMDGRAINFPIERFPNVGTIPFYVGRFISGDFQQSLQRVRPGTSGENETGPEVSLGFRLKELYPNENFIFMKYARGSTSLIPNMPSRFDWRANGTSLIEGDGEEYIRFQNVINSGLNELRDERKSDSFEVVAFLWTQGEADAQDDRSTADYQQALTNFIVDVRANYGNDLPFFLTQLSDNQISNGTGGMSESQRNEIHAAQIDIVNVVPNTYSINTDGEEFSVFSNDIIHFDAGGQIAIGTAYAESIASANIFSSDVVDTYLVPLGNIGRGVARYDGEPYTGYLMYSATPVHERFADDSPHPFNASHIISVTYEDEMWRYDNNEDFITFTPEPSDILLASVDYSTEPKVIALEGDGPDVINGIQKGYDSGNISFQADMWGGSENLGEVGVLGSYFLPYKPIGDLGRGVAAIDNVNYPSYPSYLMYSTTPVHERFPDPSPNAFNASHIISITYDNENQQWLYDNNDRLTPFTPQVSDVLLASADLSPVAPTQDEVTLLEGTSGVINGIQSGYESGDIGFEANTWNGLSDGSGDGEFGVFGTYFVQNNSNNTKVIGDLGRGVARTDGNGQLELYLGYLMYSAIPVHDRFISDSPHLFNARHIISVTYQNGQWRYDNNEGLSDFTPEPSDILIASVDALTHENQVTSLEGTSDVINGIRSGYISGDISFEANMWGGAENTGEFGVTGSFFVPNP